MLDDVFVDILENFDADKLWGKFGIWRDKIDFKYFFMSTYIKVFVSRKQS